MPRSRVARTRISAGDHVELAPSRAGARFQPTLRNIAFWSCYIYSPRGSSYVSEESRLLCARLKSADPTWLPYYAGLVYEHAARHGMLSTLFARESVLVPVPGSAPSGRGVWAAHRLALALQGVGLGGSVWSALERRFPVRKSATASNAERPTVHQHYESFAVTGQWSATAFPYPPTRLILVDDVITKGRTILAAAVRLHEAFPHADIRAFALVRTMGLVSDVSHPLSPCHGIVRWAGGDSRREP